MLDRVEQLEENEFVRIFWVIECLNTKGEKRLIWRKFDPSGQEWGRTYGDDVTSNYVVRQLCERHAEEVCEDMLRHIEWEFNPDNPKARGWESPSIRKLQGLHSFYIRKVQIHAELQMGSRAWKQPNCDPERTV